MRRLTSVCLALLCVMLLCFGATAQEKQNKPVTPAKNLEMKTQAKGEEYYHAFTADLKNAEEHSKMLYHQASEKTQSKMNMMVARQHIDAIGASLDQARKNLAEIERNASAAEKEESKDILADMHKSLTQAEDAYTKLKAEVEGPKPNQAAITQQAATVNHECGVVMGKHEEMKTKYYIQEPPAPVWPQPEE